MRHPNELRGFTLTELMVALALMAIVVVYVTQSFTVQHETYTVVDDVAEMQQNARVIADLLEREIRVAGLMVPEHAVACGVDNTNTSDLLFVSDGDAINPAGQNQNVLSIDVNAGYTGVGASNNLNIDGLAVEGAPFYDTNGDAIADADFQNGGGAIIVDLNNPERGSACGIVAILGANTIRVDYDVGGGGALGPIPAGGNAPDVAVVPAHVYQLQGTQLLRDGMVLADDVEDLQVALFFDVDDDGIVDSELLEYPGAPTGNVYNSGGWDNRDLREIRVNLVTRSATQDPKVLQDPAFAQSSFQVTENRVAPGGLDGFRRRVMTSVVRPRNVGARGI